MPCGPCTTDPISASDSSMVLTMHGVRYRSQRSVLRLGLVLSLAVAGSLRAETPAELEFFEAKVRPILVERCQKCHGETKHKGGLRLDSQAGWQKGGDT